MPKRKNQKFFRPFCLVKCEMWRCDVHGTTFIQSLGTIQMFIQRFFCQLLLTVAVCGPIHSIRRLVTVLHTKRCQWSNGKQNRLSVKLCSGVGHPSPCSNHPRDAHSVFIVFTVHKTLIPLARSLCSPSSTFGRPHSKDAGKKFQ